MNFFAFRSIRTRIVTATTFLILALLGSVVSVWTNTESDLYRLQKLNEAKLLSVLLSNTAFANHLAEHNWSQIRINLDLLLRENKDFVYILVSDARIGNQIVAASPGELQGQYIPDVVPVAVTNAALTAGTQSSYVETFVLRDLKFAGSVRAQRGERVLEVASDIRELAGKKIGTLRFGIALRQVDQAVAYTVNQALWVGAIGLLIGWIFAYILAMRLIKPILSLQASAMKIAAGDLQHRAQIDSYDEIRTLAASFNGMSSALQASFDKLQKTLISFERFVPDKFIAAIATNGVENIQVGVASTRNMTILFCDIRGYTSMSEQMTPLETFTFLNDYLACMGEAIDISGGFIDKYIGDAIMALFDAEETDCAVHAAMMMQRALCEFNKERIQVGRSAIAAGIGIHRGEVIMGTVGFTNRIDSTVIGDAVNLASRVEGLTKQYNCSILVTESVVSALLHRELFVLRLVDKSVKVKGKEDAIALYEVEI